MAEKIRPLHLPPTSTSSQQPLLVPTSTPDSSAQHGMSVQKPQQVPGHHPQAQGSGQPDIALHARPASSSGPGNLPFIICRYNKLFIADQISYFLLILSCRQSCTKREAFDICR